MLNAGLLKELKATCSGQPIITVAGKLDHSWRHQYKQFATRIQSAGLTVTAYEAPKRNWHAKVAIRLSKGKPIAALLGSSNLTLPAYGESTLGNWNYECDALIWIPSKSLNAHFRGLARNVRSLAVDEDPYDHMELNLTSKGPRESSRLKKLYEEVLEAIEGMSPIAL